MTARPAAPALIDSAEAFARAFGVSRETLDRLATYEAVLRQWQTTINLVAPSTIDDVWHRHFADSAQLLSFASAGARRWLDLGSGAGFPGLVVAIVAGAAADVTLVESDIRKSAFLREVARRTGVAVDIRTERIEKASTQTKLGPFDVVTARALAPVGRLLGLAYPFFSSGTKGLFLKGREARREIEEARAAWSFTCREHPSLTDAEGRVVVIENLAAKTEG